MVLPSEIRIWTTEGDLVYMLSGHTSFIYSLSVLPTGEIVSAGEDRTVRIWRGMSTNFRFAPHG
jgi:phospholipase A-2-activating protein